MTELVDKRSHPSAIFAHLRGRCLPAFSAFGLLLAIAPAGAGQSQPQDTVPFVPLHTYYISPTGDDANAGTSPSAAWKTPRHPVQCGDVVIAAAGRYGVSVFGTNSWGAVSSCPSTQGEIDGKGGVYFATLLCAGPDITSCTVDGGAVEPFRVDASNWAVEGFSATQHSNGDGACFSATSETTATLHHVAFINDLASHCDYSGFDAYSWTAPGGVDQTAVVGAISYDGSPSLGKYRICGSGVSIIPVDGPDASPGTHVFVAGYFGYRNVNAPTGAGCNTDGEGLIFDSWTCSKYMGQGVAEQNVWWLNGNSGFEVFPNCPENGDDKAKMYIFNNSSYGNEQDPNNLGAAAELFVNQVSPAGGSFYKIYGNIFVATEATAGANAKTPVVAAAIAVKNSKVDLVSITDNTFWQANPGTRVGPGNPNTDVSVSGWRSINAFPFGANAYVDPGLADPAGLPTTAPNCHGYTNTTDCMNRRYRVAAKVRPSGGAVANGYQPPGPCAPDPYYPDWLKGLVYLHWNGSGLTENSGLITKPCNM